MNGVLVLVLLIVTIGLSYGLYCVVKMFLNVAPGRTRIAALLPLALFDDSLFNEKGNIYRKRAIAINLAVAMALLLIRVWRQ